MKEDRKNEFKKFMSTVKGHVADVFRAYNSEVERRNEEQIGGVLHKNDKSEKIYTQLTEIAKELSIFCLILEAIEKQLYDC